ncbi:hypothetical protein AB0N09_30920 [Streptomyces erythrochromogenes]|uniref:hypothetical protein n=1 Tax=Streptomyces erythrochromogenes TaxID=285574 RepID=UPI00341588B9
MPITTDRGVYPTALLDDLRTALIGHFTAQGAVPDAVDCRITEEHGHFDGLAWAADGAMLHTRGDTIAADDLSLAVGVVLDDLTELAAPGFGDTLVIILTPGYAPPTTAEEQDEMVGPVAFDPADPAPFFDALADKALDACGRALLGVRTARLRQRLTASRWLPCPNWPERTRAPAWPRWRAW